MKHLEIRLQEQWAAQNEVDLVWLREASGQVPEDLQDAWLCVCRA